MSLQALTDRAAHAVRRSTTLTPSLLKEIDGLRQQAAAEGVAPQFETILKGLFRDRFDATAKLPPALIDKGVAQNAGAGGSTGSALQFFALKGAPVGKAADVVRGRVAELKTSTPMPVPLETQFPVLSADQAKAARAALEGELAGLRVYANGAKTTVLDKLKAHPGLSPAQTERVLDALAQVKRGYETAGATIGSAPGGVGYQDVNWKHTRLELDRVLDVAKLKKLTPQETETALLASIFSDAVKTPGNFVVHNVHGAEAALHVLGRGQPPLAADQLEDVVRAALEHQIGPPKFMAHVAVSGALRAAGVDANTLAGIALKIAHPLEEKYLTPDKSQIAFSKVEKEALEKIGVFAWTVPQAGSRHERASRAVIDGDSLVNYACPDGWAKIAALHGPHQPIFLQEPLLKDSLTSQDIKHASARKSWDDALAVISPEVRPLYEAGRRRTELAIDRVMRDLDRWVALIPKKDLPKTKDGKVPYLTGPLDYGSGVQVAFATRLRDEAVRLLRNQEGLP